MIDGLFLIKNGVPFDIAFTISPIWRRAFVVALGEMSGARYDWQAMAWPRD